MRKWLSKGILCLVLLTGCAKVTAEEVESNQASEWITLSDHTETSSEILLTNVSDQNIVALYVRSDANTTFKNDLLIEGGHFQPDEKRLLYVELADGQTYQIGFISQGRTYILHTLPFDQADTFDIHIKEEYAYLTYKKGKKTISTEEEEKEAAAGEAELIQALEEQVPVDDTQAPSMDFVYPSTYVDPYANYYNYYYDYSYYYEPAAPESYEVIEPDPGYVPDPSGGGGGGSDTGGGTVPDPVPVDPTPVTPEPAPTPAPAPDPIVTEPAAS